MALLVDKHRPRTLEALNYHKDLSDRLKSLVSRPQSSPKCAWTRLLKMTANVTDRRKAAISLISLSTALLVLARRLALLPPSKSYTVPEWRRSRSTRVSSRPPATASSNSTSSRPSTTSRLLLPTSATTIALSCRTYSKKLHRRNKLTCQPSSASKSS